MLASLNRLGQREWSIIAIVLSLLLGFMWWNFIVKPMQGSIATVRGEVDRLTVERDRGRAAQAALPQLRDAISKLEAQRQEFLRELPPQERLGEVLRSITQKAVDNGVSVKNLSRSNAQSEVAGVRSTNLSLQIESPFGPTYRFLKDLEQLQRFTTVSGLNLAIGSDKEVGRNPPINTSLTMTVYTFSGEGLGAVAQGQTGQNPGQPGQNPSGQTGGQP
jgi:type IV pilus assembly protein PilO